MLDLGFLMKHRLTLIISLLLVFSVGTGSCQIRVEPDPKLPNTVVPFKAEYKIQELGISSFFVDTPVSKGKVHLDEVSGMAYSIANPGFIWVHQDSGDEANLYLLDADNAEVVATYHLDGFTNRDWEDMAVGPGPEAGKSYLYVGETGDNAQKYGEYWVLRLEEPRFENAHRGKTVPIVAGVEKLPFRYPSKNHDVECVLVDPLTKNIYLVTKRDFAAVIYEMPYPQVKGEPITVKEIGVFPFTFVTGGSVSNDGLQVAIRTYDRIFYWNRTPTQTFAEMMASNPNLLPYQREAQGEAICFHPGGGYFTLSERATGEVPDLFFYPRK